MTRGLIALIFGAVLVIAAPNARAAELLMFEEKWCTWCERWNDEIGPIYPKTTEGKRAPLRRVDIHGEFPEGISLKTRPHFTPTFILIQDGRELGRIEGYPGEDFFWGLLARLMDKLPAPVDNALETDSKTDDAPDT